MPEYAKLVMQYRINMPHCDRVKTSLWPCCILHRGLCKFIMFFPWQILQWLAAYVVFGILIAVSVGVGWFSIVLLGILTPELEVYGMFVGVWFFIFMLMHERPPGEDEIEGLGPG